MRFFFNVINEIKRKVRRYMNKDTEKMMGVKNMKKVIKLIGKVLLGFVILLIVFLVITSVWHHSIIPLTRLRRN